MAQHPPVTEVDSQQLEESRTMWRRFTVVTKWVVIAHIAGLLFLALVLL